ncbi:hypothetical protein WG902_01820 [Ramlibacter sp. PS3R-8]|uniref:hypothetical protein n=1 Tax=Ramlibacter sp. PS3R-8 TaxID=3133437 RepID=UPI00309B1EB1
MVIVLVRGLITPSTRTSMALALNQLLPGNNAATRALVRLGRSARDALACGLGARARTRACRPTSLAVFDVGELPELRQIFGDGAARHTVAAIQRALQRIDPIAGRVSRTTATTFAVLLHGYDVESANAAVRQALGETLAIESDWHGEEIVVVPDFLIRPSGDSLHRVGQLHRQMLGEIADQQQSVRRHRDYLRRERESHLPTTRSALLSAA